METIRGKKSLDMDLTELKNRIANYNRIILDLGTGDGRYVHHLAQKNPQSFIIGVDSCRENLREYSRAKLSNMLFVIANAESLPCELNGLISHIAINFPWGSLLESLLDNKSHLLSRLESISASTAFIDLHLNSGALNEAGWSLESGTEQIHSNLLHAGWQVDMHFSMSSADLRRYPTTWAKRIAVGRDLRAISLSGWMIQSQRIESQLAYV
jgi:hypothetical protein